MLQKIVIAFVVAFMMVFTAMAWTLLGYTMEKPSAIVMMILGFVHHIGSERLTAWWNER